MNILIIDDDKDFLFLLAHSIKKQNHRVFTVNNGMQALDALCENRIDLIISDVIMSDTPIMSLTCTLKKLYPLVPIILISGLPACPLIHNSLTLGANEFVPKPINLGLLLNTINRLRAA
jgi:DNA-binding NtrC family response regulator